MDAIDFEASNFMLRPGDHQLNAQTSLWLPRYGLCIPAM